MVCILKAQFTVRSVWGQATATSAARRMLLCLAALSLVACTPTFNWREVGFDQAGVSAVLPCKPDRGTRPVQLAGQSLNLSMLGCEAGGAMFTVSVLELPAGSSAQAVLQDLRAQGKASFSKELQGSRFIAQAAVYGQPKEAWGNSAAVNKQNVETFLSQLKMAGVP